MQVWAAIDLLEGSVVTLKQGRPEERMVWSGDPLGLAARWQEEGADGLHLVDLDAALRRGSNREIVSRIVRSAHVPVQVGGGVRDLKTARGWLDLGAERIVVGTMAFAHPEALAQLLNGCEPSRVVIAADYREGTIVTDGWTESHGIPILDGIRRLEEMGVANVLVTSVGRDGTGLGPDLKTISEICSTTEMKVIASGGVRDAHDIDELEENGVDGIVIGRALYEGRIRISDMRRPRLRL